MKTVIEMAKEAGFMIVHECDAETGAWYECFTDEIERFAELVRADAIADEREACAKVADGFVGCDPISAAIRARSNT